uniref:Uncharacterized protein n=1 Tax=Utricularia reniformis TaxID=192314 RepID=A0A1Y0AZ69_9LAMI|nr:hypothetical protein AEK19_MT2127 [Utricularia reniformis]ART30433.1 hypothetical protein AEK19_MT2127 [Utricularia reniformis]
MLVTAPELLAIVQVDYDTAQSQLREKESAIGELRDSLALQDQKFQQDILELRDKVKSLEGQVSSLKNVTQLKKDQIEESTATKYRQEAENEHKQASQCKQERDNAVTETEK